MCIFSDQLKKKKRELLIVAAMKRHDWDVIQKGLHGSHIRWGHGCRILLQARERVGAGFAL